MLDPTHDYTVSHHLVGTKVRLTRPATGQPSNITLPAGYIGQIVLVSPGTGLMVVDFGIAACKRLAIAGSLIEVMPEETQ